MRPWFNRSCGPVRESIHIGGVRCSFLSDGLPGEVSRAINRAVGHAPTRSRWQQRKLCVEWLEERRPLTAASFQLIGVNDYQANTAFSGIDGSGSSATTYSIAILDTGADLDHEDFGPSTNGVADKIVYSENFVDPLLDANDDHFGYGHGTHVASVISRLAPGAKLIILKTLDTFAQGNYGDELEALEWIWDNRNTYNIIAVNMSFGEGADPDQGLGNYTSDQTNKPIHDILGDLAGENIAIVAATGNQFARSI